MPPSESEAEGRRLPPGDYGYDEVVPGDWYETAGVTVTEAHVVGFAGISGDLFDVHMDDEFARQAGFPGRIAHGLLGLSLADGLKTRCNVRLRGIATLSWNWSFRAPLLIGDRMSVRIAIAAARPTKRLDRGIVTLAMKVVKQTGEIVQEGESLLMMARGSTA
jgi:3-hydroxybutyryl-CoA dehydratase